MLLLARTPPVLLDPDTQLVHAAASALRVPEFAFFHLAHRRWYGAPASDAEIEPYFMLYLYRRKAPVWVRHLAREITALARTRPVRPEDYGVVPVLPPPVPGDRGEAVWYLAWAGFYGLCFALIAAAVL